MGKEGRNARWLPGHTAGCVCQPGVHAEHRTIARERHMSAWNPCKRVNAALADQEIDCYCFAARQGLKCMLMHCGHACARPAQRCACMTLPNSICSQLHLPGVGQRHCQLAALHQHANHGHGTRDLGACDITVVHIMTTHCTTRSSQLLRHSLVCPERIGDHDATSVVNPRLCYRGVMRLPQRTATGVQHIHCMLHTQSMQALNVVHLRVHKPVGHIRHCPARDFKVALRLV